MENYLLNFSVISRSIAKIFLVELSKRKLLYSQNELFNYETVEWIIQSRKITELLSSRGHGHSIDAWSNITRVQHESFYKITPVAKNKFIKIYWEKNSLKFSPKIKHKKNIALSRYSCELLDTLQWINSFFETQKNCSVLIAMP